MKWALKMQGCNKKRQIERNLYIKNTDSRFLYKAKRKDNNEWVHGREVLQKANYEVDYILTHGPPTSELALMGTLMVGLYKPDYLSDYLDDIMVELTTKKGYLTHFYGHMHVNKVLNPASVCLYERIM